MIASIVGDFHSGAIASFVDELGNRGVCADRVLKMSAFTWGDFSVLLRKLAAALAAQPLWRVTSNWWRVECVFLGGIMGSSQHIEVDYWV